MLKKPRQRFNWWKQGCLACAAIIALLTAQSTWNSREGLESAKLLTRASNEVVLLTQSLKALRASQAGWVELGKFTNDIALLEVVTNMVIEQRSSKPLTNYFTKGTNGVRMIEHEHTFPAGWTEPWQLEGNYVIPQFLQSRHCFDCGFTEFRKAKAK